MTELLEHFELAEFNWSSAEGRKPLEDESAILCEGSATPLEVGMPDGVPDRDVP